VDLVERNEDGAQGFGWPSGTKPLQVILKLLERFPDLDVRAVLSICDDTFIEVIPI
jgi:hypothetical protein